MLMLNSHLIHNSWWGCAVCFGDPEALVVKGMNYGIISMLIILAGVMFLFGKFFWNFRKRVKQMG